MRVDRLMNFAWKYLVPLAIVNVLVAGIWYEIVIRPESLFVVELGEGNAGHRPDRAAGDLDRVLAEPWLQRGGAARLGLAVGGRRCGRACGSSPAGRVIERLRSLRRDGRVNLSLLKKSIVRITGPRAVSAT